MLKLALRYMRYYKDQTAAIWLSIFLTAILLSGVSSLLYSSDINDLENTRRQYGDWHYCVIGCEDIEEEENIVKVGRAELRDVITRPYLIRFICTDENCRQMLQREIVEGSYPEGANEIAADRCTLGNLGFGGNVGDKIVIDGKEYLVTGIVNGTWATDLEDMEIFVGSGFEGTGRQPLMYLKFDESRKLYKQLDVFLANNRINMADVIENPEMTELLGGEKPQGIFDIVKFGLTDEDGNLTYIVLTLQNDYNLSFYGITILLCFFSVFVINSIFTVSVSKRVSEYGIMQTLGIREGCIAGTLLPELWILFLTGYPLGCIVGNTILKMCYGYLTKDEDSLFFVSWEAVAIGAVFLFVSLAIVALKTVFKMRGHSIRNLMDGDTSYVSVIRRIHHQSGLVFVVIRRFMFSNKLKALGIVLSLSLGGCLFFCSSYLTENLKIHADMTLRSDDGLNSEYAVTLKSNDLMDSISSSVVDELRSAPELASVYATKFTLGELLIDSSDIEWDEFFDEQNRSAEFSSRFGGICVDRGDGITGIKYDVYGYDDEELEQLRDFVLEGQIEPDSMEDRIILVALMDGQGNYNSYGKHPGDIVTLRVPDRNGYTDDLLRFEEDEERYIEKEFQIAAIVSRPFSQESGFLNSGNWSNMQSVILTNEQMENDFGITGFRMINASHSQGVGEDEASRVILAAIGDTPKAVFSDLTTAIDTQKAYLNRQQALVAGISVILLAISLFHITNSMNHSVMSRRREYGVMRAVGMGDLSLCSMVLRIGVLYGLLADLSVFLIYNLILRRIIDYYMAHVLKFLHFTAAVPNVLVIAVMLLNILIASVAVLLPGRRIIRENVIEQL